MNRILSAIDRAAENPIVGATLSGIFGALFVLMLLWLSGQF